MEKIIDNSGKSDMDHVAGFGSAFVGLDKQYIALLMKKNRNELIKALQSIYEDIDGNFDVLTPPVDKIFNSMRECPWENLKVVIIGQDPYPKKGDADGKAFSVSMDTPIPASLQNIFKCLEYQKIIPDWRLYGGDLGCWAKQGVLLLNTALTTEIGIKEAHLKHWKTYIDIFIKSLCEMAAGEQKHLIFMLWGKKAQEKSKIIESVNQKYSSKHVCLMWGHPSPINTSNSKKTNDNNFIYCDNFAECGRILSQSGKSAIDWGKLLKKC